MKFEFLVAVRYLKAKRKQAVISLITLISIVGVAAGVAALIIALAVTRGFREDLQKKLLGAQPHISITAKKASAGITDYMRIAKDIEQVPGVVLAAPAVYQTVLLSSETQAKGVILKGIIPEMESRVAGLSENLVEGNLNNFHQDSIIIGKELSRGLGSFIGDHLKLISAGTRPLPFGLMPINRRLEVTGIFESGLFDYDSGWAYIPLATAQRLTGAGDVVNIIEVKVNEIYQAKAIGASILQRIGDQFEFSDWTTTNATVFQALSLERLVTFVTIGLIVVVAALNIVATLIMMVLEKTRDIAILLSMGATNENIRRIFILQGVIIGVIGTVFGVMIGEVTSYFADKYRLIPLAPEVYPIAYVPFNASPIDAAIVATAAIVISFLATLYPSAAAAKLQPVEALRYE